MRMGLSPRCLTLSREIMGASSISPLYQSGCAAVVHQGYSRGTAVVQQCASRNTRQQQLNIARQTP